MVPPLDAANAANVVARAGCPGCHAAGTQQQLGQPRTKSRDGARRRVARQAKGGRGLETYGPIGRYAPALLFLRIQPKSVHGSAGAGWVVTVVASPIMERGLGEKLCISTPPLLPGWSFWSSSE